MSRNRTRTTGQPKTVKQDALAYIVRLEKENAALKGWIVEYRQVVQAERENMGALYQEMSQKIAELEAQLAKTATHTEVNQAFLNYSHQLIIGMTGVYR